MFSRIRIAAISFTSGFLLLLVLCLGAQNLKDRHSLRLGLTSTAPLPTGFILGISIIVGVISGGTTVAIMVPNRDSEQLNN